jgi:hypothetical protein
VTALFALPDHEVVGALLPGIEDRHLDRAEALKKIADNPGIVPVAIDPFGGGRILWADIADNPLREWQFIYTIKHLAEADAIGETFTSDFDILDDDAVGSDGIYPTGFIFHVSRCGSTLVAKAVARSEHNIVINQGGPLQRGFWAALTDDWRHELEATPENLARFRRLVLAMSRKRRPDQTTSFVKFISWNVLYLDFISRAFPDVPSVFLYRDPVEVIASVMKETTAALVSKGGRQASFLIGEKGAPTAGMTDIEYLAHCYANYFKTALEAVRHGIHLVNYTDITPATFPAILGRGLAAEIPDDDMSVMLEQFRFHSKDDEDATKFEPDVEQKIASISQDDTRMINELCATLVGNLDESPGNLFVGAYGRA